MATQFARGDTKVRVFLEALDEEVFESLCGEIYH